MQVDGTHRTSPADTSLVEARATVVIITRDRCAELDRTLSRLSDHRPPPPVIVMDNASTDNTAAVVDSHRSALPGLRHVRLTDNLGALGRNHGVLLADTPYVAFCDDDSWWAPGSIDRAANLLDAHRDLGAVTGRTLVGVQNRPDPINDLLGARTLPAAAGVPLPRVLGFLACATMVRTEAFRDAGGFSPVLGFVGEEALLAMDLAARGWQLFYDESIVIHHHPSLRRPPGRAGQELANRLLTAVMRRPVGPILRSAGAVARGLLSGDISSGQLRRLAGRLPRAIAARKRLPATVEYEVRALERARP